jgi:hypothetical protein
MAVVVMTLPPLARAASPGTTPSQAAAVDQNATGSANASQADAGNQNASGSGGNPGGVSQSNTADAGATGQTTSSGDQSQPASMASNADTGNGNAQGQGVGSGQGQGGGNAQAQDGTSQGQGNAGSNGQGGTGSQAAKADASSTQTDPSNSNVSAASGAPGDAGGVSQANASTADAAATAQTGGATPAASQTAGANASADQQGAGNTSVSVRVGSGGNDGPVDQSNLASASAQASADTGQAAASAQAGQTDPTNTNVSVRVFSPGDTGPVSQTNAASAAAGGTGTGDTSVDQTGAVNTNVSIRVGSPGSDGSVTQSSTATTSGASVSATSDGVNTDLSVVVDGTGLGDPSAAAGPGQIVVWNWNWTWNSDTAPGSNQTINQDPSTWNWNWDGSAPTKTEESITTASGDANAQTGRLNWSWTWQGAAPDWTWQPWQKTIDVNCACIWNWTWSWTWTGTTQDSTTQSSAAPQPTAPVNPGSAAVDQQNNAGAEANAQVSSTLTQAATSTAPDGSAFAGQLATADQQSVATAYASQDTVLNTLVGEDGAQTNVVTAHAEGIADAWTAQTLVQGSDTIPFASVGSTPASPGAPPRGATQWAGQQVAIEQTAASSADAQQTGAGNHTGHSKNNAHAQAGSKLEDTNRQDIVPTGSSMGGTQTQWSGQLVVVAQDGQSQSHVVQTGRRGGDEATSTSSATATAVTSPGSEQLASGAEGTRSQTAEQLIGVDQTATATALTVDGAYGPPSGKASSSATSADATLAVQDSTQQLVGSGGVDDQESSQLTLIVQAAQASSTSYGGTAGVATVVNCATVGQSSVQGINASASAGTGNLSSFCTPPAPPVAQAPRGAPTDNGPAAAVDATPFAGRDLTALDQPDDRAPHRLWTPTVAQVHAHVPAATPSGAPARLVTREPRVAPPSSGSGVLGAQSAFAQVSAPTVIASPSAHAPSVADDGQTGPPPSWPSSLFSGAASTLPSGSAGGGVAATMAAFLLVLLAGWWIVSDQTFRRSGFTPLGLQSPG